MSLRPSELALVMSELSGELLGSVVQKVWAPSPHRLVLALRQVGRTTLLFVCTEPTISRVSVLSARSADGEGSGSALQRVFRQELVGSRLTELPESIGLHVVIRFERDKRTRWISAQLGSGARIQIERTVPANTPLRAADGRPSRLVPAEGAFPLASAAERLFVEQEAEVDLVALRRRASLPLQRELKRLDRTLGKVQLESERTEAAEEHRRFGEMLRHYAGEIPRGAREVTLFDYTDEGTKEVTVPVEPGLSKRAQVERHFHQYRRLQRGSERARERLLALQAEKQVLVDRLRGVETMPLADLRRAVPDGIRRRRSPQRPQGSGAVPDGIRRRRSPLAAAATRPAERKPYNVYIGSSGQAIWVGRGGSHNDALTFRHARPEHWWIHARGVSGAHVVVPLGKGMELSTGVLLDAAHLALYHSAQRAQGQGEISYTRVKYVRKIRGKAKGQVTYSQDKTFWLRIEEGRLARLLASRSRLGSEETASG